MLCKTCKFRTQCAQLCKEVEEYAEQDHVSRDHTKIVFPGDMGFLADIEENSLSSMESENQLFKIVYLTRTQERVVQLRQEGFRYSKIAEMLGQSNVSLRVAFHNAKQKINIFGLSKSQRIILRKKAGLPK